MSGKDCGVDRKSCAPKSAPNDEPLMVRLLGRVYAFELAAACVCARAERAFHVRRNAR